MKSSLSHKLASINSNYLLARHYYIYLLQIWYGILYCTCISSEGNPQVPHPPHSFPHYSLFCGNNAAIQLQHELSPSLPSDAWVGCGLWGSPQVVDLIHHGDRITSFDLFLGISASCVQRLAASSWCMCVSAVPAVFAESYVHSSNSFLHTALLWKSRVWQLLLFWYCIIIILLLSSLHFLFSDAT